ncbi:hypothetical protein [Alteraurantiacibacter palmitatis]|uniref:JmjC domain-containing protein n=1 Tax=Alteraurantiacibacter palmitatis TaxID=2054628 RepID=A0ABV7E5F7_9SPHN
MVSPDLRERLRDPAYRDLHLAAVMAMRQVADIPWYDAHFLRFYETAKLYLAAVRPDALECFVDGFAPLRTPPGFTVQEIEGLFGAAELEALRAEVAGLPAAKLRDDEIRTFGRHVVQDHPAFLALQRELTPRVSAWAGQEVEPGYNFLSLYGNSGRCALHMDQPISMYTLDICIDQDVEWPIWFSDVVDWPDSAAMAAFDAADVKARLPFTGYTLQPGKAILFSGSSQWHYRDAMPRPGFCHLLFFHYYPKGCLELVESSNWPRLFDLPELEPLIDIFREAYPEAVGFRPVFG